MKLQEVREVINAKKAVKTDVETRFEKRHTELSVLNERLDNAKNALLIVQKIAKQTQEKFEYRISTLVSLALSAVFEDPYEMKLKYDTKRNKTEARIVLVKNGFEYDPLSATGGGVVDIVSFALRIALWSLAAPKSDNVIIADEPFKMLSADLQYKAGLMLKKLSEQIGLQFIIVTHNENLVEFGDRVFKISINSKGESSYVER